MIVAAISLENFRNFQSLDMIFNQGFVVLDGPNGSGKTNFLEAIYFGGLLKRFPETKTHQLFRAGTDFFRIWLKWKNQKETTQEVKIIKKEDSYHQKYLGNGQGVDRRQYVAQSLIVSFLPQDLGLLTRSPGNRRRYLNETLGLSSPAYRFARMQYELALEQRNRLLTEGGHEVAARPQMDIWDEKLAELGTQICAARQEYFAFLNERAGAVLDALAPEIDRLFFVYRMSGATDPREFLKILASTRRVEQQTLTTMVGPHRDDFLVKTGDREAVGFLSRGQMQAIVLALKILEKEYLQEHRGLVPTLLLDDIFSEFDAAHRQALVQFLASLPQVFLTTTRIEEVKGLLPPQTEAYRITQGALLHV